MNSRTKHFLSNAGSEKRYSVPLLVQSPSGKKFIKLKPKDNTSISPNVTTEDLVKLTKRHSAMPASGSVSGFKFGGAHRVQPSPVGKLGRDIIETFLQSPQPKISQQEQQNVFEVGFKKGTAASQFYYLLHTKESQVLSARFSRWKFLSLSSVRNYKVLTTVTQVTMDQDKLASSPTRQLSFEHINDDQEALIYKAVSALFRFWGRKATRSFFTWKFHVQAIREKRIKAAQKRKMASSLRPMEENLGESADELRESKVQNLRFLHKHEHLRIISPVGLLYDLMSRLYYPKLKIAFRRIEHGTQFSSRLIKKTKACIIISQRMGQQMQWTFNKWRNEANQLRLKTEIGGAVRLIQRREREVHSLSYVGRMIERVYFRALSRGFIKWKLMIENNHILTKFTEELKSKIQEEHASEEQDLIQYEAGTGEMEGGEQRLSVLSGGSFVEQESKFKTPEHSGIAEKEQTSVEKIASLIKMKKGDDVLMHRIKSVCYEMLLDILEH